MRWGSVHGGELVHTSVALGDPSPIFTAGLSQVVAGIGDLSVSLVATDEPSLVAGIDGHDVDVVLSCFEPLAASARLARTVDLPVIAMSWVQRTADVLDALRSGVRGMLSKSCEPDELREVIHAVRTGHLVYPHGWEHALLDISAGQRTRGSRRADDEPLTQREAEIVHLLLTGMSAKQIASRLGIAVQTVKNHVHNILRKLGVASRAELYGWARDRGWDRNTDERIEPLQPAHSVM